MNDIIFLILAALLFIPTFAIGIVLFIKTLSGEIIAKAVCFSHGLLASCSLALIIIYLLIGHWKSELILSALLLTMTALIGLSLVKLPLRQTTQRILTIIHPVIAIAGIIFLVLFILA